MGNNDTLSLCIEEDNESVLGIKLENNDKNTRTKYELNLMDLHEDNIHCPPAEFESVITLPSVDFQKICRDMHNLADNIDCNLGVKASSSAAFAFARATSRTALASAIASFKMFFAIFK